MDIEQVVITSVVRNNRLSDFLKSGLGKEDFSLYPDVVEWIINYGKTGERITEGMLREQFPKFSFSEETYDFPYILETFSTSLAKKEVNAIVTRSGLPVFEWVSSTIESLSRVLRRSTTQSVLDYNIFGDRAATQKDRFSEKTVLFNIPILDETLRGIPKGSNFSIIAPQKSGKTWFVTIMVKEFILQGYNVLVATKEIKKERMRDRLDAVLFDLDYYSLTSGLLSDKDIERWEKSVSEFKGGQLYILEDNSRDINSLLPYIRDYKPDIVIIDGAYIWSESPDWKDNTAITRKLASWAREFNIILGYTWQANVVETKSMSVSQIGLAKLSLTADVSFAIGINRSPELRSRGLMEVAILTSRESDTSRGIMGFSFNNNSYPEISVKNQEEFDLEDSLDSPLIVSY